MRSRSSTEMNEFFQGLESEQSWHRKVLVSYFHSSKAVFLFFLQLFLLSDPQLCTQLVALCTNQHGATLRRTTYLRPVRVCVSQKKALKINQLLDFAGKSRSSDFVQKKVHSSNATYASVKNKQICIRNLYLASSMETLYECWVTC